MSYKNYKNPIELDCYRTCSVCSRCEDKGRYAKCGSCSGRFDPKLKWDPKDIDDQCRCREGILQVRLQNGKLIQARYPDNPYNKTVKHDPITQDEKDWDAYLDAQRELHDDPNWDPITFNGKSTTNWTRERRGQ